MKILRNILSLSGLTTPIKIAKIAGFIVLAFLLYRGLMTTWDFVAQNNPSVKREKSELYNTIVKQKDSLKMAENNILSLSRKLNVADSLNYLQKQDIGIKDNQIKELQSLNLLLKRANDKYKENGVYFIYEVRLLKRNNVFRESTKQEVDSLRNSF